MAIIIGQNQKDKEKEVSLNQPTQNAQGVSATQVPQRAQSSGQFTNIQKYLGANQGVGQNIAGRLTQTTGEKVAQATGKVGEVSALSSDVQSEKQRIETGAKTIADTIREGKAATVTTDPNQFTQARQLVAGETQANQQLTDLSSKSAAAQSALQQAGQTVSNLGTEGGRFSLLRKTIGAPSYTAGQQRLDQLLTQTQGGQQLGQAFNQQRGDILQKSGILGTTSEQLQKDIQDYNTLATTEAQNLQNLLGTEISGLNQALSTAAQEAQAKKVRLDTTLEKVRSGQLQNLSQQELADLGIMPGQQLNLFDLNLNNFLTSPQAQGSIGIGDVASQEQAANLNAMNALLNSGVSNLELTGKTAQDYMGGLNTASLTDASKRRQDEIERAIFQDMKDAGEFQFKNMTFEDFKKSGGSLYRTGADYGGGSVSIQASLNDFLGALYSGQPNVAYSGATENRDFFGNSGSWDIAKANARTQIEDLIKKYRTQYGFGRTIGTPVTEQTKENTVMPGQGTPGLVMKK